ncbi:hypothetical protein GCM10029964_098660 [Kibdelosporangium lantanae]
MLTELAPLVDQIARRADKYDRTATFPGEDFDDLFAAGLNAPTIPGSTAASGSARHSGTRTRCGR